MLQFQCWQITDVLLFGAVKKVYDFILSVWERLAAHQTFCIRPECGLMMNFTFRL